MNLSLARSFLVVSVLALTISATALADIRVKAIVTFSDTPTDFLATPIPGLPFKFGNLSLTTDDGGQVRFTTKPGTFAISIAETTLQGTKIGFLAAFPTQEDITDARCVPPSAGKGNVTINSIATNPSSASDYTLAIRIVSGGTINAPACGGTVSCSPARRTIAAKISPRASSCTAASKVPKPGTYLGTVKILGQTIAVAFKLTKPKTGSSKDLTVTGVIGLAGNTKYQFPIKGTLKAKTGKLKSKVNLPKVSSAADPGLDAQYDADSDTLSAMLDVTGLNELVKAFGFNILSIPNLGLSFIEVTCYRGGKRS